jgi:hypothetical protein
VLDALKPGEDLVALQHAFDTFGDDEAVSKAPAAKTKEKAPEKEDAPAAEKPEAPAESKETPTETEEEAPAEEETKGEEAKPGE